MAGEDFDGDDDDEVTKMGVGESMLVYRDGTMAFKSLKGIGSRLSG